MSRRKATLEERLDAHFRAFETFLDGQTAAFLRQCARGRSTPRTLARKAAELLEDHRMLREAQGMLASGRLSRGLARAGLRPDPDYMNPRPGWWPESGFAAQDRPDWS